MNPFCLAICRTSSRILPPQVRWKIPRRRHNSLVSLKVAPMRRRLQPGKNPKVTPYQIGTIGWMWENFNMFFPTNSRKEAAVWDARCRDAEKTCSSPMVFLCDIFIWVIRTRWWLLYGWVAQCSGASYLCDQNFVGALSSCEVILTTSMCSVLALLVDRNNGSTFHLL